MSKKSKKKKKTFKEVFYNNPKFFSEDFTPAKYMKMDEGAEDNIKDELPETLITRSSSKYILDDTGETPIPCRGVAIWGEWFEGSIDKRVVAKDLLENDVSVSTVFLGLDHGHPPNPNKPILWETLVSTVKGDNEYHRCGGKRRDAQAMHDRVVMSQRTEMLNKLLDKRGITTKTI